GIDGLLLEQNPDSVRQLYFASASRAGFFENAKNLGRQNVAADDRQIRRRLIPRRFFDDVLEPVDTPAESLDRDTADHPIMVYFGMRDLACCNNRGLQFFE